MGCARLTIRQLLLIAYGGIIGVVFVVILVICATVLYTLSAQVVDESDAALRTQVSTGTNHILAEGAEVFAARLLGGVKKFALPAAYAVHEATRGQYSISVNANYPDSQYTTLKNPPFAYDMRFPCDMSETANQRSMRGCQNCATISPQISGCQGEQVKKLSTEASSVYLTGFRLDQSNVAAMMSNFQASVDRSGAIDDYVRKAYEDSTQWMGAYVALGDGSLYRSFPGYVGDLAIDSIGRRSYNPTTRSWYTAARQAHNSQSRIATTIAGQDRYAVEYSEPYEDRFGSGWLISATVPINNRAGNFIGVAGTDVQVSSMQDIVSSIRLRQSGEIHLFNIASRHVVASRQWAGGRTRLMDMNDLTTTPGGSYISTIAGYDCAEGRVENSGWIVIKKQVLQNTYCMVAVIKESEVLESIDSQRDEITSTTNILFAVTLVIIIASLLGLVAPCAIVLAIQLSRPLKKTSDETSLIAKNIGGDLLKGIDVEKPPDGKCSDVAEVTQLRTGFLKMLGRLKDKRERTPIPPKNPAFGKLSAQNPDAPESLSKIIVKKATGEMRRGSAADISIPKTAFYNRITIRLVLQLIMPMVLALALIISITSAQLFAKVYDWMKPVKAAMIAEELQMLDIRAKERAFLAAEIFGSYTATLAMVKDYTERIFDGEITPDFANRYSMTFSPPNRCPSGTRCAVLNARGDTVRMVTPSGQPARDISFDEMVWYQPIGGEAPSNRRYSGSVYNFNGANPLPVNIVSDLENVARVAYFASSTTYVYWGFEHHESYVQYPYTSLSGTASGEARQMCSGANRYTPLCRTWYTDARAENGAIKFGNVGMDSNTLLPFLPIGAACFHTTPGNVRQLIGVASLDVNLGELEDILRNTPLYASGRAYLFDSGGYTIVHPDLDEASTGARVPIADVVSGEDMAFRSAYQTRVVEQYGQTGTAVIRYQNPSTDEPENWHYSFLPVEGTPYQMVLGVVDYEVEAAATTLEDELYELTGTHVGISIAVFVIASLLLIGVSYLFQRGFVKPVKELVNLINNGEANGYDEDLQVAPTEVWSRELQNTYTNFEHLLVALRFGNPAYHKGDRIKELNNLRHAKTLIESTESVRGIGVCLSNLGNCVRGMDPDTRKRAELDPEEKDPVKTLERAVENARKLFKEGNEDTTEDTIGQRLLGLGLAKLTDMKLTFQARETGCKNALREALEIHTRTGSWKSMARLAYTVTIMSQQEKDAQLASFLLGEAEAAADNALSVLTSSNGFAMSVLTSSPASNNDTNGDSNNVNADAVPGSNNATVDDVPQIAELAAEDQTTMAQLCFAFYVTKKSMQYLYWALDQLAFLDEPILLKIASHGKCQQSKDVVAAIDAALSDVKSWKPGEIKDPSAAIRRDGAGQAKCMQFVLDCSGSMAGAYLNTCKKSLQMIVDEFTGPKDLVGFIAFAHYTKDIFKLRPKEGNEEFMRCAFANIDTFGGTAFFDAVRDGLQNLHKADLPANMPKWVIALTDGADQHSKQDVDGYQGCNLLKTVPRSNLAIITVGDLPEATISMVKKYVQAAEANGNKALHIVASDSSKIAEAFQSIGEAMADDGGLAEHL